MPPKRRQLNWFVVKLLDHIGTATHLLDYTVDINFQAMTETIRAPIRVASVDLKLCAILVAVESRDCQRQCGSQQYRDNCLGDHH